MTFFSKQLRPRSTVVKRVEVLITCPTVVLRPKKKDGGEGPGKRRLNLAALEYISSGFEAVIRIAPTTMKHFGGK